MAALNLILVVLHGAAFLAAIVGLARQARLDRKAIDAWVMHPVLTQLVTGVLLVGVLEGRDEDVDGAKIAVKLAITLVLALLVLANRRKPSIPQGLWAGLIVLECVNAVLAFAW